MLEAFSASSPKAKVLNVLFLLLSFIAWVCCCVSFGGELMEVKLGMGGTIVSKWHWNYFQVQDTKIYFNSENCALSACHKCNGGGKGMIAMQVFSFIGLTAVLFLTTVRILGASISFLEPTRKSLFLELTLTIVNTFFFFLAVCIFGGACFHAASAMPEASGVKGTGFAFLIVSFFFLIGCSVIIYLVRGDSSTHLGSTSAGAYASEHDAATTDYNPPASYQYNAETSAAAYAGSYNGDVMPAASGDSNL